MCEHFRTTHMTKKFVPKSFSFGRTFDEPWNIGKDKSKKFSEVWFERGKRIVCSLCVRARECVEQTRFTCVRKTNQTNICHELKLERKITLYPFLSWNKLLGRTIYRTLEMFITVSATATLKQNNFI